MCDRGLRTILLGAVILVSVATNADTLVPDWEREFAVDGWNTFAYSGSASQDGIYVVNAGNPVGENRAGCTVTRIDQHGNRNWALTFEPQMAWAVGWAYSCTTSDGSVWVACAYLDFARSGFLDIHRITKDGTVAASLQKPFDFETVGPRDVALHPRPDQGLAYVHYTAHGPKFVRVNGNGNVELETNLSDTGQVFAFSNNGNLTTLGFQYESPVFSYAVDEFDQDGNLVWKRLLTPDLDRTDDTSGLAVAIVDGNVTATVGAYQTDTGGTDHDWMRLFSLKSEDGTVVRETNLDSLGLHWVPQPSQFGTGGTLLLSQSGVVPRLMRVSRDGKFLWDKPTENWLESAQTDRFGNVWAALGTGDPMVNFVVDLWYPDSRQRGRHALNFQDDNAFASWLNFDSSDRAYVIGGHGSWGSEKTIVCQYLAKPNPLSSSRP